MVVSKKVFLWKFHRLQKSGNSNAKSFAVARSWAKRQTPAYNKRAKTHGPYVKPFAYSKKSHTSYRAVRSTNKTGFPKSSYKGRAVSQKYRVKKFRGYETY